MEDQRSGTAALRAIPTAALTEPSKGWPQTGISNAAIFKAGMQGKVKAIGPGDGVILDYSPLPSKAKFLVFLFSDKSLEMGTTKGLNIKGQIKESRTDLFFIFLNLMILPSSSHYVGG